ncbi:hypothetical protein [Pseudomonas frederiksbergensis]|nr:hypothetical protein [Pseudomonas frederiksbergensis]
MKPLVHQSNTPNDGVGKVPRRAAQTKMLIKLKTTKTNDEFFLSMKRK